MKNGKFYFVTIFFIIFTVFINRPVFAGSSYVLPYPSSMPGSTFYKIELFYENILKYWSFGNFAKFKYYLGRSDKYIVEAKTLFEYKQYLLAYAALKKSDKFFEQSTYYLKQSQKEKKQTVEKEEILKNAALKHIEVMEKIEEEVPGEFTWKPEKTVSTHLLIKDEIENSIRVRRRVL